MLIASVLIAGITADLPISGTDKRLSRKQTGAKRENQIKQSIDYTLKENHLSRSPTEKLGLIFRNEIYIIADVQNVNFNIYDLEGRIDKKAPDLVSKKIPYQNCLDAEILNRLKTSPDKRYVEDNSSAGDKYQASYTYINDGKFKPIGILNLPYYEDPTFNDMELREFLMRLGGVYLVMLLIAIALAYFISKYITRSLDSVTELLAQTDLTKRNKKILIEDSRSEIGKLIESYNAMIDELEQSAAKLARSEREQAWREMAKQVAHEIKNPLTPMRLSVQSFERKFDPDEPNVQTKVAEYSKTLIQQIDTMSSIASAFSNFAEMPAQQNETLNVVNIVKLALDIFNENYIHFISDKEEIIAKLDRTQLIRVVTNLVKNAIQAVPEVESPRILVSVAEVGDNVKISVADNGIGITDDFTDKIFEPKFTTKSSGMGLGLGMVKNIVETYNGHIDFTSQPGKGTVFTVIFPKEQPTTNPEKQ